MSQDKGPFVAVFQIFRALVGVVACTHQFNLAPSDQDVETQLNCTSDADMLQV